MSDKREKDNIEFLLGEIADSVSFNLETSLSYLEENGVDVQKFINKGLKKIAATEKKLGDKKAKVFFFKRVVLAAEIVYNLHNEKTFGHVKFQKLMFLCERVSNMQLANRYVKQAAGPFDNRFMHIIDKELMRLKWFSVVKKVDRGFNTYKYYLGEDVESYKKYFDNYYGEYQSSINWLITTFRSSLTRQVELVATIYACVEEILVNENELNVDSVVESVYAWSKEKQKFSRAQILAAHSWMIENKLYPKN